MRQNLVGRTLGDFRLEAQIGQGAMGKVYRAVQISLRRTVAVKVLEIGLFTLEEWKERFVREVEVLARLEHAHIVPVYATGEDDGLLYFAMRLVEGPTLAERIECGLAPADGIRILAEVCGALAYAHARGVIHRDVKPANVLISGGTPLLTDFGLARMAEATTITGSGALMGTPRYLSPEQARREKATAQSDVYPVAVILYEIATGRHPYAPDGFERVSRDELVRRVAAARPLPPRHARANLPPSLAALLDRTLAGDPADRPADASEMRRALLALLDDPAVRDLAAASRFPPSPAEESPVPAGGPSPDPGPAGGADSRDASAVAHRTEGDPPAAMGPAGPSRGGGTDAAGAPAHAEGGAGVTPPSAGARMPAAPTAREFGKFWLLSPLGQGGMGVVFRAEQPELNRVVALKVLREENHDDPRAVARFATEARAAARLRHPGIVPIHEVGEIEGRHYFTMDCVEGEDLDRLLGRGPQAPNRALEIVRDVARAVHHAHEQGIVHRDLKPGNILVERDGRVRVGDFGLARDLKFTDRRVSVTGEILGTPGYMAPEQARGRSAEIGPAADVFGLGAILYHLVTGRAPYVGEAAVDAWLSALQVDFPPPRRIQPRIHCDIETICLKAMAEEPARRYASAAAFADDCDRFLCGEPIQARPPAFFYRLGKRLARDRRAVAVAGAALLVVTAVLAGLLPTLSDRKRELAWRDSLRPVRDAVRDARPFLYIPGSAIDEKLRLAREAIEVLESRPADDYSPAARAESDAMRGLGWYFVGEPAKAEAALRRALERDPRTPGAAPVLGRILLERAILDTASQGASPPPDEQARTRAWADEAARWLASAEAGWGVTADLERDVAAAWRAVLERRRDESLRRSREGLERWGEALGTEEFWLIHAMSVPGEERPPLLERALARRPHYPPALFLRALARAQSGDLDGAARDYDRVVDLAPGFSDAYVNRGHLRARRGDRSGSLEDYARALAIRPQDVLAHCGIARRRLEARDYRGAVEACKEALQADPGHAPAYNTRGNARRALEDLDGAEADFTEAIRLRPDFADAFYNRARVHVDRKDWPAALRDYDRAEAAGLREKDLYANRGNVRLMQGDPVGAEREYARALEVDPGFAAGWFNRGVTRLNAGRPAEALPDFDEALRLKPGWPDARSARSAARAATGDIPGAIEDLEEALRSASANWRGRGEAEINLARLRRK